MLRWGLVPFVGQGPEDRQPADQRPGRDRGTPSPRSGARSRTRRCLLPADGYYEWQRPEAGNGGVKQPYFISRSDGGPLAFAGLYELWRDPSCRKKTSDAWLWTTTIITTSAPDDLGQIHDRMPMIMQPDRWADWLDPAGDDPADLMPLLAPAASSG